MIPLCNHRSHDQYKMRILHKLNTTCSIVKMMWRKGREEKYVVFNEATIIEQI